MTKGKISIIFTVIIPLVIGIIIISDLQRETNQELEQRIRSAMEMARKNPDIFNNIDNQLRANGHNIIRGSSLEFTRKDGLNILIEIPKGKGEENANKSKKEIKEIVSEILKLNNFDKFNISVKVVAINANNYSNKNIGRGVLNK
ncbi:MAG TPA: hypothetical protein GXX18_04795 [Bacillales bacterium]|nr:hypothetical protein [Bacillales bacterium]